MFSLKRKLLKFLKMPSLDLFKLSSKSTVKYSNSTFKFVIEEVFNILTVSFNACKGENEYGFVMACLGLGLT